MQSALVPLFVTKQLKNTSVSALVRMVVNGLIELPELQRQVAWNARQYVRLLDSLLMGLGAGAVLEWQPTDGEPSVSHTNPSKNPSGYLLDGLQRVLAYCMLLGSRPHFLDADEWQTLRDSHAVQLNPAKYAKAGSDDEARLRYLKRDSGAKLPSGWIRAADLFATNPNWDALVAAALPKKATRTERAAMEALLRDMRDRVRKTRVPMEQVACSTAHAFTAFERRNAGTPIKRHDLVLSMASVMCPGFVRDEFRVFQQQMTALGIHLDTSLLLRCLVAEWLGQARLTKVGLPDWETGEHSAAWTSVKAGWQRLAQYLLGHDITALRELGAENVTIPLVVLAARYDDAFVDDRPLQWMLRGLRSQRYKSQQSERLRDDIKVFVPDENGVAPTRDQALTALFGLLDDFPFEPFSAEELRYQLPASSRRLPELVVRLALTHADATDFRTGDLVRNSPEFHHHHFFSQAACKDAGVPAETFDALANVTVLTPSSNESFGSKLPRVCLSLVDARDREARLASQLIPAEFGVSGDVKDVYALVQQRAGLLADLMNTFVADLGTPAARTSDGRVSLTAVA